MSARFAIRLATVADRGKMMPLVANSYLRGVLISQTDTTLRECEEVADCILTNVLPEGHSTVIEKSGGEICSFSINGDFAKSRYDSGPMHGIMQKHRHFGMLHHIKDHLETRYAILNGFTMSNFPVNDTMRIHMSGTDPNHLGNRFVRQLTPFIASHSEKHDFSRVVTTSTSSYTQRLADTKGISVWDTIRIADWFQKGSIYARSVLDGHHVAALMVLDLKDFAK